MIQWSAQGGEIPTDTHFCSKPGTTEAARVLATALVDIEQFGLEFGRPHVEWSLAAARLGLRQFAPTRTPQEG